MTDTSKSPALGGQPGPNGREPGLSWLHQQRYEEMTLNELIEALDKRSKRLFACDCAERALSLIVAPDPRSIEAIRVARLYAIGKEEFNILNNARIQALIAANEANESNTRASAQAARAAVEATHQTAMTAAWAAADSEVWTEYNVCRWVDEANAWLNARNWQKARAIEYLTGQVK
jgi:hypothetical protein